MVALPMPYTEAILWVIVVVSLGIALGLLVHSMIRYIGYHPLRDRRRWCALRGHPMRPWRGWTTIRECACGDRRVSWTNNGPATVPDYWFDPWTIERINRQDFMMNRHRD